MLLWITLFFVAVSYGDGQACDDGQPLPLGCVNPLKGSGAKPQDYADIDTTFLVYDQNDPGSPQATIPWNANLNQDDRLFDTGSSLTFIIHGFLESSANSTVQDLKDAVLQREPNPTVILVDWGKGAFSTDTNIKNYPIAANNALKVARVVASFVRRIMSTYGVRAQSVHIIGHSLGGQIMGLATARLASEFRIKIARGTASDAAAPLFANNGIYPNKGNVGFMLAIHTSSKLTAASDDSLGVAKAFADVDLYPNRGRTKQPACRVSGADPAAIETIFCSHVRGYIYLTEILNKCEDSCGFEGFRCRDQQAALNGQCGQQRPVNVCAYFSDRQQKPNANIIATFTTDGDTIQVQCPYNGSPY